MLRKSRIPNVSRGLSRSFRAVCIRFSEQTVTSLVGFFRSCMRTLPRLNSEVVFTLKNPTSYSDPEYRKFRERFVLPIRFDVELKQALSSLSTHASDLTVTALSRSKVFYHRSVVHVEINRKKYVPFPKSPRCFSHFPAPLSSQKWRYKNVYLILYLLISFSHLSIYFKLHFSHIIPIFPSPFVI